MTKTDKIILRILAFLLLLFFASGLIPLNTMWGFNHLLYFTNGFIYSLIALFLILFIPAVSESLYKAVQNISGLFNKLPLLVRVSIMAIFAALIFNLFSVHVHALGDGYQRVYQVEKGYLHNPPEPLDFFLHSILYIGLNKIATISAESVYTSLSIIFGVIFIIAVYLFKFQKEIDKTTATMAKLFIISFGSMQIFFGYVESYSLLYVTTILFVLCAFRFISDGKGLILISVLFALAVSSHQSGLILTPVFIYVIYFNITRYKPVGFRDKKLPIIIGAVPFAVLIGLKVYVSIKYPQYQKGISDMLLPFYAGGEYSVLSPHHLFDIFNESLLIAPVLYLIVPINLTNRFLKNIKSEFKLFGAILVGSALLFIFLVDPKLGFARDWDLFATPMALASITLILTAVASKSFEAISHNVRVIMIIGAIIMASAWIGLNASEIKQLQRAENLIAISERNRGYAIELLAHYYWQIIDNKEKALQLYYSIDDDKKNARVYNKITQLEYKLNHYEKAIINAVKGLQLDSMQADLHILAGASYKKLNQPLNALSHLNRARQLKPYQYNIYSYLGSTYLMLDSLDLALAANLISVKLKPDNATCLFNTAYVYIVRKEYDSAQVYWERGMKMNPDYKNAEAYLQLIDQGRKSQKN